MWGPGLVYSRLFRFPSGPDVATPSSVVECDVCESWRMVDPTTYRVVLRPDVRWHDLPPANGRLLRASDVVFSYERQATPGWPNADLLRNLESAKAIDDLTLELRLGRPDPEFLSILADGHSKIVAPEVVALNGNLLAGPNIGTGPWLWEETTSVRSVFVANPDYYEPGLPRLERLEIAFLSEGTRFSALLTEVIDLVQLDETNLTAALERKPDLQTVGIMQPGSGMELAIKTTSGPFESLEARQAFFASLRPWETVAQIWGGDGFVSVGLPVPERSWLLDEAELRGYFSAPGTPARPLAGDAIEPDIEVVVGLFGERYRIHADAIAQALTRAGLTPTVRETTTRDFGDDVWFGGKFQVFVGAQPPIASLTDYLFAVYHSKGTWNTTGYSTPELDALIESQAVELDLTQRREMVLEVQRRIIAGAHRFAPASRIAQWAFLPAVKNFHPNTVRGENGFLTRIGLADNAQR